MRRPPSDHADDARVRIQLLGKFAVIVDGHRVPGNAWRQRRAAAVVKCLALADGHRLHRDELQELLWSRLDPAAQANNLRQTLHHARRAIVSAGLPADTMLCRDGDLILLAAEPVWVDVRAFEQAVERAWSTLDPDDAQLALAIYAGDLLPEDRFEEWSEPRRTMLRASYLALLGRLARLLDERGSVAAALACWQRLVHADPLHELAHLRLMQHYAHAGQRQLALAQYDLLRDLLAHELDVEPDAVTREFAAALRTGERPTPVPHVPPLLPITPVGDGEALIGRQREFAELVQLLDTARLLTLTGPGGVGKTRLALAVARACAPAFADGVQIVDLSTIQDPSLVPTAIADVLGVPEQPGEPLLEGIVRWVGTRELLLVIDNVEQVIDAAPMLATLLARCPALRLLVTSRMRLGLHSESLYPVGPLPAPTATGPLGYDELARWPATALFLARAAAARPDVASDTREREAIAELCRRLDGLPLAIELAAARCRLLTPSELLDRLRGDHQLALLSGGSRDLPARQRALRDTIRWSYELLTPDGRRQFARLAVFAGGWTLDAAEAVCAGVLAGDAPVIDGLSTLSDLHLITRDHAGEDSARFTMLETIREFAREQLATGGEAGIARDRHADWVVALAERAAAELEGPNQGRWLTRLEQEDGNIRAALAWLRERGQVEAALRLAVALRLYWFTRGRALEACAITHAIVALPGAAAYPALLGDALNAAAFLAREVGDDERTEQASRASLALAHQQGDRKRAADALVNLGYLALRQDRLDDARALFQRSLATMRSLGNEQGIADTLSFLGVVAHQAGDLEPARCFHEESLARWDALGDRQAIVWARIQLARTLLSSGDADAAWGELQAAFAIVREIGWWWGYCWGSDALARLALAWGDPALALRLAALSSAILEVTGTRCSPHEQREQAALHTRIAALVGVDTLDAMRAQARALDPATALPDLLRAAATLAERHRVSAAPVSR